MMAQQVETKKTENMDNSNIDTRILRLGKWQIPRSERVFKMEAERTYLSMGYFDMIEIVKADCEEHHAFRKAYKSLMRQKWETWTQGKQDEHILEEYRLQEFSIFTNSKTTEKDTRVGFMEDEIQRFWGSEQLLLFISLIHIDNESNVTKIVDRIRNIFDKQNYLYYFSFDYSGIVLFSKCNSVANYLKLLFRLNYEKDEEGKKLIRDSYSFYGLYKEKLKSYFTLFKNDSYKNVQTDLDDTEKFTAVVNIGVQNYETYKKLWKQLEDAGVNQRENMFGMLGRHDISVVKNDATMKWLVYVQYLLDELTKEYLGSSDKLFSTHETFIKIKNIDEFKDTNDNEENKFYTFIKDNLEIVCQQYSEALRNVDRRYHGQYHFPVQEIRYSILSILKNRYAENFVLCLYRPFVEFLTYLTVKLQKWDTTDRRDIFNKCYTDFFNCLNALVNSAMHSERQFIQATAFDAVIYDVPAKILAFYMALIDDVKEIMRGDNDKKYTFILTPSFSNDILVSVISYQEENVLPHDRILKVEINEKSLYNPPEIEWQIVHEVAHFMGDDSRKREIRKERMIFSVIFVVLIRIFHSSLLNGHIKELEVLTEELKNMLMKWGHFSKDVENYSSCLYFLGNDIQEEFKRNEQIKSCVQSYLMYRLEDFSENVKLQDYVERLFLKHGGTVNREILKKTDRKIISNMILLDMEERMSYLNVESYERFLKYGEMDRSVLSQEEDELEKYPLGEIVRVLLSIYYEAYADIQEVLITGIDYQDYLLNFLGNEEGAWELETKDNMEDMGRISMVCMVMEKCGFWKYGRSHAVPENRKEQLQRLHTAVQSIIQTVDRTADLGEVFGEFRERNADYIKEMSHSDSLADWILSENNPIMKISFTEARLYLEVLRYLYRCVESSVKKYSEKKDMIINLRNTMDTVNQCRDIQEVFIQMSQKTEQYKEKIVRENGGNI